MRIGIPPAATRAGEEGAVKSGRPPRSRTWTARRDTPFFKLLESVYDAVFLTTRQGLILACNERATEFFRTDSSALVGQSVVALISGATPALLDTINENLASRKYTLVEARCKRADGASFAAEIAVNPVALDAEGQLCFFVRDITVRQQAQQALENAVERLQAHDRARMEFVSNVSHELRTPLTSMIYAVTNMLRGVVGPLPEKAVQYLERLQADCQRLLATVNDILDLRQIENKTLVLAQRVVPLGPVIREGVEALQVQADAKRISLRFDESGREVFSRCDARKIERVALNIVGNALKFTPEGGRVSVTIEQHPEHPRMARISVCDTGAGIPPGALPRLSQRYFRVGDHVSGSGLGLAISREIVELHNGSMAFESPVPGQDCGTAVRIALPLAPKPVVLALAQDDGAIAFIRRNVSGRGYGLRLERAAQAALESCLAQPPMALTLDGRITDMDVRDLILHVREDNKTRRLPVIVLGERALDRAEMDLCRHYDIFYAPAPWSEETFGRMLSLAALDKRQGGALYIKGQTG